MPVYEYKVVPAPSKGRKGKGVKGTEARFAFAIETVMNDMAGGGWEFLRSETLPSEERSGLASTTTTFRSILVFRRVRPDDVSAFQPKLLENPEISTETPAATATAEESVPDTPEPTTAEDPKEPFAAETGENEPDDLPVALVARAAAVSDPAEKDDKDHATG